jgi:2-dehydro-3-deoxygalactonokinase
MPQQPSDAAISGTQRSRDDRGLGIALDWGTTNLRAFLIDAQGAVIEEREKPWGILSLPAPAGAGGFDKALQEIAGDWMAARPAGALIASGMVGSAQGWREAPYVRCPAGARDLVLQMTRVTTASGRELMIVPGILLDLPEDLPDVIRGEETQVIGALQSIESRADAATEGTRRTVCFVLPGTHSKWVLVKDRRIVQFATYMTGELFANLKQHSILGRLMTVPGETDAQTGSAAAAFLQALALARDSGPGDLMRHLFSVRSMNLAGRLPVTALADYLSGLLIGHEVVSASSWLARQGATGAPIVLIGESLLLDRYKAALATFDLRASSLRNTAAVGLHHLLTLAG